MENELMIKFLVESEEFILDIKQPDLAKLIHIVVEKNLMVTKENIRMETESKEFDVDEFLDIFIGVYEEFSEEITKFFVNIKRDIKTYYSNEELGDKIISKIKGEVV